MYVTFMNGEGKRESGRKSEEKWEGKERAEERNRIMEGEGSKGN